MPTPRKPTPRTPNVPILALVLVPLVALAIAVAQGASSGGNADATAMDALPVAEAQAERGAEAYAQHCALCHGPDLEGSAHFPTLSGATFQRRWAERTLGELYTYVSEQMPLGAGGSLEDATYAAVVAYLLSENGVEPGETPFDPEIEAHLAAPLADAGWETESEP